jgi:hypothetical protein
VTAASSPQEAIYERSTADADAIMGDETSHLKRRRRGNDSEERLALEEYESQREQLAQLVAQVAQEEQEDNGDGDATGEYEIDPDL